MSSPSFFYIEGPNPKKKVTQKLKINSMEGLNCETERLPEACVSHVLSFTSPKYVCRAATVSPTFRQAADSDTVWSHFLPVDHREILSRAVDSVRFSSYKELYFKLCDSVLLDGGSKVLALDKKSGAKCITLHAKELSIVWGGDQRYWRWVSHPNSRFTEVAELQAVCWLDISCSMNCKELSPNTTYKAYLIFNLAEDSYGLSFPLQDVSVKLGAQISQGEVCVHCHEGRSSRTRRELPPEVRVPRARSDGWMEVELGEFYNEDGSDGDVDMTFKQTKSMNWKRGLIIEGVQLRPM